MRVIEEVPYGCFILLNPCYGLSTEAISISQQSSDGDKKLLHFPKVN
jgi:hypothetical protein